MRRILNFMLLIFIVGRITTAQWYMVHPINKTNFMSVSFKQIDRLFIVDDRGTLLFSKDKGLSWNEYAFIPPIQMNSINFLNENFGYIVGDKGKFFTSGNDWNQWNDRSVEDYFQLREAAFIDEVNGVVVGSKEVRVDGRSFTLPSVHITNDAGLNWQEIEFRFRGSLNSVAYSQNGFLIAVGDSGLMIISRDYGNSWVQEDLGSINNLNKVRICPDNSIIIVGDKGSFYYSFDLFERWRKVALPEFYDLKGACFRDRGKIIAVGSKQLEVKGSYGHQAVIISIETGSDEWIEEYTGSSGKFNSVSFCNPELAAAVGDQGVISIYRSTTNIENETDLSVISYQLIQNYPNPFNPVTKISWHSPIGIWQVLKVFDVLGSEVATIVDEYKPAGRYEVEFNAGKLSSGIYFYQLKAGEYTAVKKMLLMK